jgi:hypothetical protein
LLEYTENTLSPIEREWRNQELAALRLALSEEAYTRLWAEGRALTLEQAVAYGLEAYPLPQATLFVAPPLFEEHKWGRVLWCR